MFIERQDLPTQIETDARGFRESAHVPFSAPTQ